MKILVTGCSGFIGSNLILELQKRYPEHEIVGYDNFLSGNWKNLIEFRGQIINLTKDLERFAEFDVIFHLGANTDTTNGSIHSHLENNVNDGKRYLYKGKFIIYASSASVYGVGSTRPNKEDDQLKPANAYAFSKMQLEIYMDKYHRNNSTGFRFFNVYGPNERYKGKSKSMVSQILGAVKNGGEVRLFPDGNQVRDFVYVKDVVDLLITSAENPTPGIYNCGTGQTCSFNELFNIAKQLYPVSKSKIEWTDNKFSFFQSFTQACLDKTTSTFNWKPKFNIGQGIMDYYKTL